MGMKIWVLGVTFMLASHLLVSIPAVDIVGGVLAVIGAVLVCLDK